MPAAHYHVWTVDQQYRTAFAHPVRFNSLSSASVWRRRYHRDGAVGFVRACDVPDTCGIVGKATEYKRGRGEISKAQYFEQLEQRGIIPENKYNHFPAGCPVHGYTYCQWCSEMRSARAAKTIDEIASNLKRGKS